MRLRSFCSAARALLYRIPIGASGHRVTHTASHWAVFTHAELIGWKILRDACKSCQDALNARIFLSIPAKKVVLRFADMQASRYSSS